MRLLGKARVVVFGLCVVGLSASPVFADEGDPEQIRSMLLEAIRANKAALEERIRVRVRTEYGVEKFTSSIQEITVDGDRFALRYFCSPEDYEADNDSGFIACDGELALKCWSEAWPGTSESHAALDPVTDEFQPFTKDLHLYCMGYQVSMDPQEILSSPDAVIDPVPVEMNGVLAYEVSLQRKLGQSDYTFKYWFAPDFSCNPVRRELKKGDRLFSYRDYGEFKQLGNGIWFPTVVTMERFAPDGTVVNMNRHFLDNVSIDFTVDEALFDTSLDRVPAGYMIYDRMMGLDYVQGQGPVSDEFLGDLENTDVSEAGKEAPRPDASGEAPAEDKADAEAAARGAVELPEDDGLSGVVLAVMALVALAAAVAVAARQWRRR